VFSWILQELWVGCGGRLTGGQSEEASRQKWV